MQRSTKHVHGRRAPLATRAAPNATHAARLAQYRSRLASGPRGVVVQIAGPALAVAPRGQRSGQFRLGGRA